MTRPANSAPHGADAFRALLETSFAWRCRRK